MAGRQAAAWRGWLAGSLSLRLAVLLSVALVPLGLIAVYQTDRLQEEARRAHLLDLRALTTDVARRQGAAIDAALGAGRGLAAALPSLQGDRAACSAAFRRLVDAAGGRIAFAGYLRADGRMRCSSTGEARDVPLTEPFARRVALGLPFVMALPRGPVTGRSVISVNQPVAGRDGATRGVVTMSVADSALQADLPDLDAAGTTDLALIGGDGTVLGRALAGRDGPPPMPADRRPADLFDRGERLFTAPADSGGMRLFAVVPVVADAAYALGSRPVAPGTTDTPVSPEAWPVLMWLASLVLVVAVVEGSLVRPVRSLSRRMRDFGRSRTLPPAERRRMPSEMRVIEQTFLDVAQRLAREETNLREAMHEKDVLLREVHHRVRNNVQIISSVINMQMRDSRHPETERALQRIASRIGSLAAVHRRLYESERVGRIRADLLLGDVLPALVASGAPERQDTPALDLDLSPVTLGPDQGLALAMLAAEATTQAMEHGAPGPDGRAWISVALAPVEGPDGAVGLTIRNSAARPREGDRDGARAGLGRRLARGFARQLQGDIAIGWDDGVYSVAVTFRQDIGDGPRPGPAGDPPVTNG